jgi:hypothetical protein
VFQVSFQSAATVAPPGWAVDNGFLFGQKNNTVGAFDTYGWNCDLSTMADDREVLAQTAKNYVGANYRGTVIRPDINTCGNVIPEWNVVVGSNGTMQVFEVHTLYSRAQTSHRGCKLNGVLNFDNGRDRTGGADIIWVVRTVNTTTGKITWSGANNNNCGDIAAMRIYAPTTNPAVDCQTLKGQCCPQFLDMANRPCSAFPPPCSNPS